MRGIYRAQTRPEPRGRSDGPEASRHHEPAAKRNVKAPASVARIGVRVAAVATGFHSLEELALSEPDVLVADLSDPGPLLRAAG